MLQGNAQGTLPGCAPAQSSTSVGGTEVKLPQSPPKLSLLLERCGKLLQTQRRELVEVQVWFPKYCPARFTCCAILNLLFAKGGVS